MPITINPLNVQPTVLGNYPCEGGETIRDNLDFATDPVVIADLSTIQSKGKWAGTQTLWIDNSLNTAAIFIVIDGSFQTITIPPNSEVYIPILCPSPPKITFTSSGGVVVPINFINFFLPPLCMSPAAAPGGGGGGGGSTVTLTDHSGNTPVALGANAARKYLLVSNPAGSGIVVDIAFTGGGTVSITAGGSYLDNGPNVVGNAVAVTTHGGGANPVTVYEG